MKCLLCQHTFSGRAFRAKAHLLGQGGNGVKACLKATPQIQQQISGNIDSKLCLSECDKLAGSRQVPLDSFLKRSNTAAADRELARFVYTSGISFNCLKNPHLWMATLKSDMCLIW
jgi:hypothetical protein